MIRASTLAEYIETIYVPAKIDLSARTVEQLVVAVRLFDRWRGAPVHLHDLSDELLCRFLRAYLATGKTASTVNGKRRAILCLWRHAFEEGIVELLPRKVPILREPRRMPEAWTLSEVEQLLAAARRLSGKVGEVERRDWWTALILSVYDTSGRIGAIQSTRTLDCNLAERYLIVRADHQKTNEDRLYWLSDQTTTIIAVIYEPRRERLFTWPYGRRHLFYQFRRLVERAGLHADKRGMNLFHKLRRTSLSYCAAYDLELARRQAGHSTARLTQRHYIDPRIARQQSAVDVLPRPHCD
ncbi:hypothetical protein LCGC14_1024770 [marine sediment metagenome]|uniref:Tyr recombinase domain-containing protein n=1 Tax=marine sediment metagenome TaxID=412755 RepID=A0A0F9QEE9_9ZZZZ